MTTIFKLWLTASLSNNSWQLFFQAVVDSYSYKQWLTFILSSNFQAFFSSNSWQLVFHAVTDSCSFKQRLSYSFKHRLTAILLSNCWHLWFQAMMVSYSIKQLLTAILSSKWLTVILSMVDRYSFKLGWQPFWYYRMALSALLERKGCQSCLKNLEINLIYTSYCSRNIRLTFGICFLLIQLSLIWYFVLYPDNKLGGEFIETLISLIRHDISCTGSQWL